MTDKPTNPDGSRNAISLCSHCNCMTKTIRNKCGKCEEQKTDSKECCDHCVNWYSKSPLCLNKKCECHKPEVEVEEIVEKLEKRMENLNIHHKDLVCFHDHVAETSIVILVREALTKYGNQRAEEERERIIDFVKKYPHKCGACENKISNLSHTLSCGMRNDLIKYLNPPTPQGEE